MRNNFAHLDKWRLTAEQAKKNPSIRMYASAPGDLWGMFVIHENRTQIRVLATRGDEHIPGVPDAFGWEHASVSVLYLNTKGKPIPRTPTWEEMCRVKNLFWMEEEAVIQFHPPKSEYVNRHNHCLHLWRNPLIQILTPPSILV